MSVLESLGEVPGVHPMSQLKEWGLKWCDLKGIPLLRAAQRWNTTATFLKSKYQWHLAGVTLQIVRFAQRIRRLPLPLPNVKHVADWKRQSRYVRRQGVTATQFAEAMRFRQLVGHRSAKRDW